MSVWWKFLGGSVWAGGCLVVASACSGPGRDYGDGAAGSAGSAGSGESSGGAAGSKPSGGSSGSGAESSGGTEAVVGGAGGAPPDESCTAGDMQTCYESPDGDSFGGKPPADQMTCRLGARKCLDDGTWEACVGAVAPLEADTCEPGNDANCNGVPNEGCSCTNGAKRACGSDVGNCKQGEQVCANSMWGECVGEIKPAATDSCEEGDDANCNDKLNEGCSCLNGKTKDCGTDVGPCEFGKLTCLNGVWPGPEQCQGGVKPAAADTCEPGNDANCNNALNENCKCTGSGSVDCGLNVGACKYGKQTCTNGVLSACTGGVNPTASDTCFADNAANDTNCNGHGRDGCTECVGGETGTCNECGTKACDGATGKYKACVGVDTTPPRCNPSDPTKRQVCGTSGVYVAGDCSSTQQCTGQGVCKSKDGELCSAGTTCASGACNPFYPDADADGYRKEGAAVVNLCGAGKAGYVSSAASKGDDCDDTTDKVNPGKGEVCDGLDNDCDTLTDFADTVPLAVSGTNKANITGFFSAIASSGSAYGIMYFKGSANKMYFTTLTQANALGSVKDIEIGTDYNRGAIAFDGTNFGVFMRNTFRTVSPAGAPGTAYALPATSGAVDRWMAVRMPSNPWLMVGHAAYGSYPFGYSFMVNNSNDVSTVTGISDPQTNLDIAVSAPDNIYGIVYQEGTGDAATEPRAIKFSPRNASGTATVTATSFDSAVGLTKPVIAPRKGGGFVVLWAGAGNKIYLREVKIDGSQQCATVSKTFANFKPEQMVPTARGYLAVSSANKTIQAQEILPGCKFGGQLPTLGTTTGDSQAHIAAGTNGFAVIWDDKPEADTGIYTRTFGPNFCD